jgi:hypothetical protein
MEINKERKGRKERKTHSQEELEKFSKAVNACAKQIKKPQ